VEELQRTRLRRDQYPFRYGFYDHSHETIVDTKAELDNRKRDIWRGYHTLIENYVRMVRGGGRWDGLDVVLHHAIAGLSYDLAVLQANHVIGRGLRGDEAMRVFWDERAELLEEVTSAWRAIRERLGVTVEDEVKESMDMERPFHRVRDDLRRLLHDLPAEAAGEIAPKVTDTGAAGQATITQPESGTEAAASDGSVAELPTALAETGNSQADVPAWARALKAAREDKGLSRPALAQRLKVCTAEAIKKHEEGHVPNPDTRAVYATFYGKPMDDLFPPEITR
jgi:hypothetical protein